MQQEGYGDKRGMDKAATPLPAIELSGFLLKNYAGI
jgi:hypothetical protein